MDSKFRKLISRLSIKEKKLEKNSSYPRTISISPIPDHHHHSLEDVLEPKNNNEQNHNRVKYSSLTSEDDELQQLPIYKSLPPSSTESTFDNNKLNHNHKGPKNILTDVHFPCPTLLRMKSKSSGIMMMGTPILNSETASESFYEELKPSKKKIEQNEQQQQIDVLCPKVSGNDDDNTMNPTIQALQNSNEIETDENNNNIIGDENQNYDDDGDGIYVNLQEIELERRRLIAAQVVKISKYTENWIDGQVIHDSILGDNKEKTKVYWESRMRNEQLEKDKLNGFNKLRSTSSTSSVIHKINEEIEELHRREKELKDGHAPGHTTAINVKNGNAIPKPPNSTHSNEDEDDVFSSNGSSMDEFEPAESPRLESGFYSNLGEDEQVPASPDLKGAESETESQNGDTKDLDAKIHVEPTKITVPVVHEQKKLEVEIPKEDDLDDRSRSDSVTPKPQILEDDEPQTPTIFTFQKETPIEKEIRLSSAREAEYRLRRQSSSLSPAPVSPKPVSKPLTLASPPAPTIVKPSAIKENEKKLQLSSSIREPKRNIQYQMATERLRKEILEAKMREEELKSRGRIQSSPPQVDLTKVQEEPKEAKLASPAEIEQPELVENLPTQIPKAEPKEHKPIERRASVSTETLSKEQPAFYKSTSNLLGLARPSFNTYQRYLIKTSTQLRIAKNFQLPSPTLSIPEVKEAKSPVADEVPVLDAENEEPITPRRKLVKATDKIEKELREMKERERELALIRTRSFKSTPNLFEAIDDDTEKNVIDVPEKELDDEQSKPKEIVASEKFERKPIVERKRSALINQWEQKIYSNGN